MSYLRDCWQSYQARRAARKRSKDIDRQLKIQRQWERIKRPNTIPILLFGSTVACRESFIQLMLAAAAKEGSQSYHSKSHVCYTIYAAIETLVVAMHRHNLPYSSRHIKSCGRLIARTKRAERYKITAEQRNNIALFWSDERVQACFSRLVEFDADFEAMRYFLDNLDRVTAGNYSPTEEDMQQFHVSIRAGIKQYTIFINRVGFRIIAAELLSKRVTRRYMYFDEMTACLFVCEIDKYNEVLDEGDKTDNQLSKSLALLKELLSVRPPPYTGHVIFFMNMDQFAAKLPVYNLAEYFPAYKGAQQNVAAAKSFIGDMFNSCSQPSHDHIYQHFVDHNTLILSKLFKSSKSIILWSHIAELSLI